ncbi:MAG: NUDIX hydrolase [Muribaculaceae bacterium]|nr:NUDIX hydrolase [Muribaculaceae bacterium]
MSEFYSQHDRLYVGVDCVIFGLHNGELSLLLTKRRFEPEMGKWSLIGGFVGRGESVEEAASRVLSDLTGLNQIYMEQVGAFGAVDRDPGERVVSVAFFALISLDDLDSEVKEGMDARWFGLNELPRLGFDHPAMIEKALKKMRRKFATEPTAFNLLPKMFTLSQLQSLYETIGGEVLDKRNFRKRVADVPCIVSTEYIDKTTSRRGARLYKFDEETYKLNPHFKI